MDPEAETIYGRVARLEDEVALLRNEVDTIKKAMRSKIIRHEIAMIKNGADVNSIVD